MGSACVEGDTVYLGRMDWSIYAYHAKTPKQIWRYKTRISVQSTPVVDDQKLYCTTTDGRVLVIDLKNPPKTSVPMGEPNWAKVPPRASGPA